MSIEIAHKYTIRIVQLAEHVRAVLLQGKLVEAESLAWDLEAIAQGLTQEIDILKARRPLR